MISSVGQKHKAARFLTLPRCLMALSLFGFAAIVSILFAPSANAFSGPTPSPGFTIVTQVCKQIGTEVEQQPDGYDTTVTKNEDGTTTTTTSPRFKSVVVTITKCEWIERKVSTGKGSWSTRPELMKNVPCDLLDFWGVDPEVEREYCETAPDIVEFPVRSEGFPEFADPNAQDAYSEFAALNGGGGSQWVQIADPSTQSTLSAWPCFLTAIDNSNPTIEIINNLSLDEIDWAKEVNYKMTEYQEASVTFRSPNTINDIIVSKTGPTFMSKGQERLEFIDGSAYQSTVEWLSCKSAVGAGGIATVTVLCPVFYDDRQVDGPYGEGLPALMDRKEFDPNSIRNVALIPGQQKTPFGKNDWPGLRGAKKYSTGAMQAINTVRGCGSMDNTARFPFRLPYLGNYNASAKLYSTTCSYSLMPGFDNGAYFGGCTGALTWEPIKHTYHADCTGIIAPGKDTVNSFDAARCFTQECVWTNDNSSFIYGRDVPTATPLTQHFENQESVELKPSPTAPDARADGSPVIWDGSLNEMIVRDRISNNRTGDPVEGGEFSVFQIDPESTPWGRGIPKSEPNHEAQPFQVRVSETGQSDPLVVVSDDEEPKNVPLRLRFRGWNNLKVNAYQASITDDRPFILKFHRVQPWVVPVRIGGFATISEFQMGGARPRMEDRQPTLVCSTDWSAANYVTNRLTANP